jgi:hypothetical protein
METGTAAKLLLALSGALLVACGSGRVVDLLRNGSMEERLPIAAGWSPSLGSGNPELSSSVSRTGTRSFRLAAPAPLGASARWEQTIPAPIPAGKRLSLRAFVKCEGVTGEGAGLAACVGPGGSLEDLTHCGQYAQTRGTVQISGTQDWTEHRLTLVEPTSYRKQNVTAYLVLFPGSTGMVYFDDVSLSIDDTELLYNGSAEEIGEERVAGWSAARGRVTDAEWSSAVSRTGTRSLLLTAASDPGAELAFWEQVVSQGIPIGRVPTLRAFIKTENLVGPGAALAIRTDGPAPPPAGPRVPGGHPEDGSGPDLTMLQAATTEGRVRISGTTDWTEYALSLSTLAERTATLRVFLILLPGTQGTVYFDDVSLTYEE